MADSSNQPESLPPNAPSRVSLATVPEDPLWAQVYRELRRGIETGFLEPGLVIKPARLAESMSVSYSSVLWACSLLATDGLLTRPAFNNNQFAVIDRNAEKEG